MRLFSHGRRSTGFYNVHKHDVAPLPKSQRYIRVWCEMDGPDGGWILIQQRNSSAFNSYRNWVSYEIGFGKPGFGYWLGNINIHSVTFKRKYVLRIGFPAFLDVYAEYDNFRVLSPSTGYVLRLGKYREGVEDILYYSNNSAFSTWDRDNDKVLMACAWRNRGAWWYGKTCDIDDLNTILKFMETKVIAQEVLEGKSFKNILCLASRSPALQKR